MTEVLDWGVVMILRLCSNAGFFGGGFRKVGLGVVMILCH